MVTIKSDKVAYPDINIGLAYSAFTQQSYQSAPFQQLLVMASDGDFGKRVNYSIYTDTLQVAQNMFLPSFHTYYLNSETKDVILMDEYLLELPEIYDHHRYYVFSDNKEAVKKFTDKYGDKIKVISSLQEVIDNVPANE